MAEHPPAMKKDGWTPLKVWSVIPQADNCNLVRFVFDDPFASAGMDVASYLLTRAFIGKEKADGTRAAVIRPYTPSHTTIGYLELVVKCYPEGKMSKHINGLKKGDTLTGIMGTDVSSAGLDAASPTFLILEESSSSPTDSAQSLIP